jgi:hypothetical protein
MVAITGEGRIFHFRVNENQMSKCAILHPGMQRYRKEALCYLGEALSSALCTGSLVSGFENSAEARVIPALICGRWNSS